MRKIGVLLPQSNQFPLLSKQFVNGLKLALSNEDYAFSVEGIGQGNNEKEVISSIQKLVNQEDAAVITGLLGHKGLPEVLDFVNSIEETLIYADLGAKRPLDLSNYSSIYCNSLDLYSSTKKLGKYLIDQGCTNVLSSTCYYEAGYGFVQAMEETLGENNEGQFAGHYITPLNPRDNEVEFMREIVNATNPDAVFAFHSGIYAEEHAAFLKSQPAIYNAPMFTLPFSVDEKVLKDFPEIFDGAKSVLSWFEQMDVAENIEFVENYKSQFGKSPSIFSVLGYENGLLIKRFLNEGDLNDSKELKGPRGSVNFNTNTKRTELKHYICGLKWESNHYKFSILDALDYHITTKPLSVEQDGGWDNAYLCS